jgi:hypothetical protein
MNGAAAAVGNDNISHGQRVVKDLTTGVDIAEVDIQLKKRVQNEMKGQKREEKVRYIDATARNTITRQTVMETEHLCYFK